MGSEEKRTAKGLEAHGLVYLAAGDQARKELKDAPRSNVKPRTSGQKASRN